MINLEDYYNPREAANVLGVSLPRISQLVSSGELTGIYMLNQHCMLIPKTSVDQRAADMRYKRAIRQYAST
jgi:excisionase family DNA binding protein